MPIEFNCSQCNQLLRVSEASAGKSARCPKCQALMMVPAAGGELPKVPSVPPPPATPFGVADPGINSLPPPPKPASSPFSDQQGGSNPFSGQPTGNVNPYASPVAYDAYRPAGELYGRTGLPWEVEPRSIGCWFRTMGIVLGSPTRAFSLMQQSGGLGTPMLFTIYGLGMPVGLILLLVAVVGAIIAVVAGGNDGLAAAGGVLLFIMLLAGGLALYVLLVSSLGMMISAAIYHVLLMMVGGAKQSYETTFRVCSYSQGSLAWLLVIPYIGPTIMSIWMIVLMIIGLAQAHEISAGKSALAVFLPVIFCAGLFGILFVIMLGVAAVGNN